MHSSPHQEASSLQNNTGHATETGLLMHSASPSGLQEEAAFWFGTPSKQTLQITKPSLWQRKKLHRQLRTMTQAVKQRSSEEVSLLAVETCLPEAPPAWCRGRNHPTILLHLRLDEFPRVSRADRWESLLPEAPLCPPSFSIPIRARHLSSP